ncbi:amino acid permease [Desemzia sp. RIT804]|uniref:APC family permease n=1 Tax=Desemzia sp. RIT 804 TaxID=2810209 RepID=UPI00194EF4A0|nr:amino acid permease [Desemzia sp. RIT 804]MBM6615229.1 amino acid permease [Desemzia sp. RIT 804]
MKETTKGLKKEISFFTALTIVMGTVIGSGVFFKPEAVYLATGTAGLGLAAWVLGGLITICGGLTTAELSAAIPETGGMVVYLRRAYGPLISYLLGWAQTVVYFPANIAALSIIFATQAVNLLGLTQQFVIPIAIAAACVIILTNLMGTQKAGRLQSVATIAKMVPLFLIIAFGLLHQGNVEFQLLPDFMTPTSTISRLGAGLVATLFAYDGWINVGTVAGEMKDPKRDLPKAIIAGLSAVMGVYVLINLAYLQVMPAVSLGATPTPAADVANLLFGNSGGKLVTIGILISVFGTINGYAMTGIRVPYAMALNNELPFSKWLKKLNRRQVPINSALTLLVIAIVMIFTGQYNQLTDLLVFVIWIFYTLVFIAVFILRKREPELSRPYKVPWYPVIPLIAVIGGCFIVINTLLTQPTNTALGIFLTVLGLPIYFYKCKQETK